MKAKNIILSMALTSAITAPAMAGDVLTGDTRSACEAILCLSTGQRPGECAASLARYFSISFRKLSDTLRGRMDFLNLCPAVNMDTNMHTLVNDIANGAGRCDAASINSSTMVTTGSRDDRTTYIGNKLPSYCAAYAANTYTNIAATTPVYVGTPERHGFWVDPANYAKALADYKARIAAEDAARRAAQNESSR